MSQVLSQNEVDALLNAVSDGQIEGEDEIQHDDEGAGLLKYDISSQDRIIRGRMPTLEIIHDRFTRLFRVSLSAALRKISNLSVNQSGPVKFGEFMNSLPLPSCLNIIKMEPLRGSSVLVIESKLLYALVDSFFGGSDSPYTKIEGKDFTPIEIKIAQRIVNLAMDAIEQSWAPVYKLQLSYIRTEINPQFVTIVPPSDVVIATTFDVELEKVSGTIKFVIPYSTLEPIKNKLSTGFQSEALEVDHLWINRIKQQVVHAKVDITVQLGEATLSVRDLLELEEGDVIQLNQDATQPLKFDVEGITKFTCQPGVLKGNRAVKLTSTGD